MALLMGKGRPTEPSLLYRAQVPLRGNAEALEAYVAWEVAQAEPQELPAHVAAGYEKAQAAVELRVPNEDAVDASKAADADLLAAYMAYIGLEQV